MSGFETSAYARRRQRGQGLLILVLLIIGLLGSTLVFSIAGRSQLSIDSDNRTSAALAKAKEALIGYAAGHSTRPGILPCPDTDNDGSADSPCGASGITAVGRLPWRTLGLPDLRDGTGDCLWYAVSGNFKNSGVSAPGIVNSDSLGTLVVNDTSGTAIYSGTNSVPAIIFAPGSALSGQDRNSAATTVCGGNTTVANYLEGGNQNGAATNTFIAGTPTTVFNDKILPITHDALFSVVVVRVAKETRAALESYRNNNGYYPAANPYASGGPSYYCDSATYHGRIPLTIKNVATLSGCLTQADWAGELPSWFASNNWNLLTHYAVASVCILSVWPASVLCSTWGNDPFNLWFPGSQALTVTGVTTAGAVLTVVSSRALGAQVHPCGSAAQCLENAANTDGNNTYVKPSRLPTSNDRMALTCGTASPCSTIP